MNENANVQAAADYVDGPALQTLLKDLADCFQYMMLASTEERVFERFDVSRAQDWDTWPWGQAFGPGGELRWRPKGARFAVCFVMEGNALPSPVSEMGHKKQLEANKEVVRVPLWGEHTADDLDADGVPLWIEAQIPQLLAYPIADMAPPIVALRVVRYLLDDGTVALVRFVELEEWNDG